MSGSHTHNHAHGHGVHQTQNRRRLTTVLGLVLLYMIAEVIGGLVTNSLALLADAGHMLSDAGALGFSLLAMWIARLPATARMTYGYYRTEILAALVNGATLIAIAIYIFVEAFRRISEPPEVMGGVMMAVAVGGLLVNLVSLWLLSAGKSESLNVRGAWLHVLTDALGSIGAIGAGILIWVFGWYWADPVASILIGMLVLYSSWSLLKETVGVLMEGTPTHIDVNAVHSAIEAVPGVQSVHDLHVWTITSGLVALSVHIVADEGKSHTTLLKEVQHLTTDHFGVDHTTVQIEPAGFKECDLPV